MKSGSASASASIGQYLGRRAASRRLVTPRCYRVAIAACIPDTDFDLREAKATAARPSSPKTTPAPTSRTSVPGRKVAVTPPEAANDNMLNT